MVDRARPEEIPHELGAVADPPRAAEVAGSVLTLEGELRRIRRGGSLGPFSAGNALEERGISVEVINLHTVKPIDEEAILNSIRKTRCAVTAEEHNIYGGMGDAVAQVAAKHDPVPFEYVGTKDTFGESGTPEELMKKYGLDSDHIVSAALRVIARKMPVLKDLIED